MKYIVALFLVLCIQLVQGQNTVKIDSLTQIYQNTKNDTTKTLTLLEISNQYLKINPDTSLILAQRSLILSQEKNYGEGKVASFVRIGRIYIKQSKPVKALEFLQNGLKLAEECHNQQKIALIYSLIARVYKKQKKTNLNFKYLQKALRIYNKIQHKKGIAEVFGDIGNYYNRQNQYDSTLYYYQESLKLFEELGEKRPITFLSYNIAVLNYRQKKYNQALESYNKVLGIFKDANDKFRQSVVYQAIGIIYNKQEEYSKAIEYYLKGLEMAEEIKSVEMINKLSRSLYNSYKKKEDYISALKYHELYKKTNDSLFNVNKSKAIANLESKAEIERKKKEIAILNKNQELLEKDNKLQHIEAERQRNAKVALEKQAEAEKLLALARQEKDKRKQDSLQNLAQQRQFEADKLKAKEKQLEAESKTRKLEVLKERDSRKFQQYINYFILAGLLSLLVFAFFMYHSQQKERKAKKQIENQKEEITQQNIQLQELNTVKDQVFSIISHDLRSPINSLQGLLEVFKDYGLTQDQLIEYIGKLSESVAGVSGLLNNLLYWAKSQMQGINLSPEPVDLDNYVREAIQLFSEIAHSKGIQTIVTLHKEASQIYIDCEILRFLLRNLLNNAYKFSKKGGKVTVSSKLEANNHVKIMIKDEGIGIDDSTKNKLFKGVVKSKQGTLSEKGTGLGLMLCQDFVEKSRGIIGVDSKLGQGSIFWFILPRDKA